jgi:hypothetical protein
VRFSKPNFRDCRFVGEAAADLPVIARSESDEAIQPYLGKFWIASLALAMTELVGTSADISDTSS